MIATELTRAEEQVMQVIWQLERCFLGQLVEAYSEKAAYTTIQTIVKILENKNFVAHDVVGKTHQYYPLVSKADYSTWLARSVVSRYFDGSPAMMVSAFAQGGKLTIEQYEELRQLSEELLKK